VAPGDTEGPWEGKQAPHVGAQSALLPPRPAARPARWQLIRVGVHQIFEYNGAAIVAMAGKECVAIGSDLRLGVQFQTLATDYKKVYRIHDKLFIGLAGLSTDAETLCAPPLAVMFVGLGCTSQALVSGVLKTAVLAGVAMLRKAGHHMCVFFLEIVAAARRVLLLCSWSRRVCCVPRSSRPCRAGTTALYSSTTCTSSGRSATCSPPRSARWCRPRCTRSGAPRQGPAHWRLFAGPRFPRPRQSCARTVWDRARGAAREQGWRQGSPGRPSLCGPVLSGSHLQAASLQSSSDSLRRTGLLPSSAAACSPGPQLRAARAPRFGPYFVSPVIAGLDPASSEPYLAGMDTIGAIETAKDFMVAGTAPDSLYGMCESMWRPDMVRAWHGCSDSSSGWRRGGGSRGGLGLRRSWQPACPSACRCTGAKAGCLALPGSACMCQQTCLLERCTPRAATAAPCARRAGGGGAVRDGVAMPAVRQRPRRAVRLGRRRLRHVRARAWRAGPARASCLLSELPVGCYGMLVWEIVTHPRPARSCRSLLAVADSVRCHQQRAAHAPVAL